MIRLAVALLLLALSSVPGTGAARQPTPAADGPPVTAMTFNIRYGTAEDGENHWTKRREQLFALLRDRQPDVLGVQEALDFQIHEILAAVPGYTYVGVARTDGRREGEYSAILYRTARLAARRSDTFWFSDTPTVPGSMTWGNRYERICTWAYFEDREGAAFYAFNVHLDHESQPSRERSTALLLERVRARAPAAPAIVMGDFNAGEQNPAIEALRGVLRDSFRVRFPAETEVGTYNGFELDNTRGEKIDYVFVTEGVAVIEAEIVRAPAGGRYPSDHFPVTARVRLR
jgi:endonuclease/exonuclease/phosphatase family metal-dependent hydrolase